MTLADNPQSPAERSISRLPVACMLAICGGIWLMFSIWAVFWPYSGDGDGSLHYLNVRLFFSHPSEVLTAWARPVFVLAMLPGCLIGPFAARLCGGIIAAVLCWQTIRLAEDLKLPNAALAAPLLIFQPFVFAVASDTMTEPLAALWIAVSIRLWLAGRYSASCAFVSFLPAVRPEGFFIIPLWAMAILLARSAGPLIKKKLPACLLLAVGMACWMLACGIFIGDWLWIKTSWFWKTVNFESYGRGHLFYYAVYWPFYCGPILFILFMTGLVTSFNRRMLMPHAVWWSVFIVHSVIWAKGAFASAGLIRILVTTSPITAIICLFGWNRIARILRRPEKTGIALRLAGFVTIILSAATAIAYYVCDGQRYHGFAIRSLAGKIDKSSLLSGRKTFFCGDPIVMAELGINKFSPCLVENSWQPEEQLKSLAGLPEGSLGVWDNQLSQFWYRVSIEQIVGLGYEIVREETISVHLPDWPVNLERIQICPLNQRYVLLRRLSSTDKPQTTSRNAVTDRRNSDW